MKRITGLLLAVLMLISVLPVAAIAADANNGGVHKLTFEDAYTEINVSHGECLSADAFPRPRALNGRELPLGWAYIKDGKLCFFNETVPVTEDLTLTYCQMAIEKVTDFSEKEITASDKTSLSSLSGIYTVSANEDIVIDNRCTVNGFAVIILPDGCSIKFAKGIEVPEYRKLFIVAPAGSEGTGRLTATGSKETAGIGCGPKGNIGTICIYGGTVTANGGLHSAGIGGGGDSGNSAVYIYGGTVTANGDLFGAGIGGSCDRDGCTVYISGGTVAANGGKNAAGIGGGRDGNGGNVYVSGGTVTANGGTQAAGIGGGQYSGNSGTITVSGGVIRAKGTPAFKGEVTLRSNMTAYDPANGEENAPATTSYTSIGQILVKPSAYDYLDVERNAYIDTGIKPTSNTRVVMNVYVNGAREYWFGAWDVNYCQSAFAFGNDDTGIYTGYGNEGGTYGQAVSNGYHTIELDKGVVKIDGNSINTHGAAEFRLNNTLYLFAQNRAGTATAYKDQKNIYCCGCEIYEGDVLVRKFVPGKSSSFASGLWDIVNGVFYDNEYESKTAYAGMTARYNDGAEAISKDAACTENGHSTYYKKSGKYYTDAECTDEITDLSVWLSKTVKNGGGLIPALGHDWEYSEDVHTCRRCKEVGSHTDDDGNRHCDTCGSDLLIALDVAYLNRIADETTGKITTEEARFTGDGYAVRNTDRIWGDSGKTTWYVLDRDVALSNRVEVRGNVRLILTNGRTLTANNGITVEGGNSLSIYAQTDNESEMGVLRITTDGQTAIGSRNGAKGSDRAPGMVAGGSYIAGAGDDGLAAGSVRFFGGRSVLSSTNAVTVGGGNGGKGGSGSDGYGGNGGKGGSGGYVYFYGGYQLLTAVNGRAIGGGNGGEVGDDKYMHNIEGEPGAPGFGAIITVYGDPVIKAGASPDEVVSIKNISEYWDQKALSVEYGSVHATGSVISDGSIWIIIAVAVLAIGTVAALVVVKKKKATT